MHISGKYFLPRWEENLAERKKCVAPDLKVSDTEAVASVKATLDNFTGRLLQDKLVYDSVERIDRKHGEKAKFKLVFKAGNDGVTTVKYNVRTYLYNFKYYQMEHQFIGRT